MEKSENDLFRCVASDLNTSKTNNDFCDSPESDINLIKNDLTDIQNNSLLGNNNNIDLINNNSVIIYESLSNSDPNNDITDDSYNYSDNNQNTNCDCGRDESIYLDINEYEHKLRRLSSENTTLNDQLMRLEEQIIDLINEKQTLSKTLKSENLYYNKKFDSLHDIIQEFNANIESLEKVNNKLEEKLNNTNTEKAKIELRFEEIEDKLMCTELQLSEAEKNVSELRMSCKAAKDALDIEECDKLEAIHQLNDIFLICSTHENNLINLKDQVDVLKREIVDKDNQIWFYRNGDRTSIGHDLDVEVKTPSNRSCLNTNTIKFERSNSDCYYSLNDCKSMESLFENSSDIYDKESVLLEAQSRDMRFSRSVSSTQGMKTPNPSETADMFPSLPDVILRKLQLLRESCCSIESLTEQEIESKFTALSLAFKTDKFTLEQRIHLQRHQRDVAEQDAFNEIQSLRDSIRLLHQMIEPSDQSIVTITGSDVKDLIYKIESQVEVVGQTNAKISSRSELYGAVKQEERMSSAFDVILKHSQNLKLSNDKSLKDLEETQKLLTSNGIKKIECDSDSDHETHHMRRSVRSISSVSIPKLNSDVIRRSIPNTNTIHTRVVASNSQSLCNRSRRRSMPCTPVLYRSKLGNDVEMSSHLEITAEEKGGSESDYASSVANPDSDDERISFNSIPRKSSEDDVTNVFNSLNVSEPTDNTSNLNNDIEIENFSQFNDESDNETDGNSESIEYRNAKSNSIITQSHSFKYISNLIEYRKLTNLLNSGFDTRIGIFVKNMIEDFRFTIAIILLITAVLIVIWSLLPTGIPCQCQCYYSLQEIVERVLSPYISKEKVSRTQ